MAAKTLNPEYRYTIDNGTGCWLWTGAMNGHGYGTARGGPHKRLAHRLTYEFHVGPIPDGLQIDHLCRNRRCVNPEHLEPVTAQENMRRSRAGEYRRNKTECPAGHPYSEDNTYRNDGRRWCRTCRREESKQRKAAARESRHLAAAA